MTRAACLAVAPQAEVEFVPVFANCGASSHHDDASQRLQESSRALRLKYRTTARFLSASLKVDRAAVLYFNDDDGQRRREGDQERVSTGGCPARWRCEPFIDDAAVDQIGGLPGARAESGRHIRLRRRRRPTVDVLRRASRGRHTGEPSSARPVFRNPTFAALAGEFAGRLLLSFPTIELAGNADFADRYRKDSTRRRRRPASSSTTRCASSRRRSISSASKGSTSRTP